MPDYNTDYPPDGQSNDYTDLEQAGYYPGKKRTWQQRLGQIASLTAWNPDDEAATQRNNQQLTARSGQSEVLHEMTRNLVNVGIDPVEAAKMANDVFASKYQADIQRSKAETAADTGNELRDQGRNVYQRQIGMNQGAQDEQAAMAGYQGNKGIATRAQTENDLGVPAMQGYNAREGANLTLGQLQAAQAATSRGAKSAVEDAALKEIIDKNTMQNRVATATTQSEAAKAAAQIEANMGNAGVALSSNPAQSERIVQAEQNKKNYIQAGYGATAENILFPNAAPGTLSGQPHFAPGSGRAGQVGGYHIVERRTIDPVTGIVTGVDRTREPIDQPPGPILSPNAAPGLRVMPNAPALPTRPGGVIVIKKNQ